MPSLLALEFPPISHAVEWPIIFGGDWLGVNKVVLLMWLSVIVVFTFFFIASRRQSLVPAGVQNVAESTVDFVRNGIILQTMGEDGLWYTPLLLMMFSFIFVGNIWEIIPVAQMPVNARIALPLFMALLVYFMYHIVGIKRQGVGGYLKSSLVPPGVPKLILPLLVFIELITLLITKPLSLCVRLFANMFAGHLLLITFAIICSALWAIQWQIVILPFSGFLLIALTGFEVLVAFLQAFIFTILTAVYLGQSMHPEH
jgi:F-type H+-transporting ATPase subunit a